MRNYFSLDIIIYYFFINISCLFFFNINNYIVIFLVSICGFEVFFLEYFKIVLGYV